MNWEECIEQARRMSDHYSLTEEQQRACYEIVKGLPSGSKVVELGVCNGKTAAVLIYASHHAGLEYTGIDNFSLTNNEQEVRKGLDSLGYKYTLITGNTHDVPLISDIDFLLVDAGHEESAVSVDIERWSPNVKKGGYIVFHDYDIPYDRNSAHWAVRFYADKYTDTWQDIDYIMTKYYGLKIRRRPL